MDPAEPIACTLTEAGAANQLLEWEDLQHLAVESVAIADGARMTFPLTQRARVEDFAARERTCCSFLTITAEPERDELVVRITSEHPDARAVIAALAGSE